MREEKGGCTMKQGKLIRRAVSAALAGCMMFTLSAPALAASTDALLQQSTAAKNAVSVLDAENGDTVDYGITITITGREVKVDSDNCNNILGFLKYDPNEKKLTLLKSNASAVNYLTIDAPNTDVVLESTEMIVSNNLLIENARSVRVSSTGNWAPVYGKVYIYCACPVTLEHTEAGANSGVAISGIEFAAPVSASDFVYYTSNAADATPTDAGTGTIPARTENYLRIVPKVSYAITADDATITVDGKAVTSAFAGEKVTVAAAGRENAEFTGWTAEGITLTDDQKVNPTVNFTMPDKNVTLNPNYNVVQDFGIYVDDKPVTSENYQNLKSGRIVYDPVQKTLTAANRIKNLLKVRAPETDVILNGGIGRGDLTIGQQDYPSVVGADDVTVTSDQYAAIDGWVYINCTGKVDIRSNEDVAVNGNLNIYDSSEMILSADSSAVTGSANITSKGDVTIESTDGRAAKNLTINKAENVTITISDDERAVSENTDITASGTVILKNNAPGGHVGTVDFTQAGDKDYVYYTSEAEDAKLIDPRIHPLAEAAGSSYLRIEPRETYYSITVANGTAQVGDDTTGRITTAFEGETVTVKANAPTDEDAAKGVKFHHWKVEEGSTAFTLTDGKLGSKEEAGTAEISFDMPKGDVKLTAVYSIPASVLRSTVTVTGGTAKSTLDEGSDIPAEIGTTVEITATPYDAEKYPGMEFVEWEIVYPDSFYQKFPGGIPENLQLKLDNAKSAATTFEMPVYPVKLIAHWSASAVTDPDEPIDEDFGVEPAPMDTTGGTIAAVAVGGAAIWGGYEIATRVILHNLLPEGAAIPANRGQLALLIWTEKGKPEPAAQPAFADITDAEQAKAAQWCVEQGLLDAREGKFESDGWMPKFKTIEIWNKAFPKK